MKKKMMVLLITGILSTVFAQTDIRSFGLATVPDAGQVNLLGAEDFEKDNTDWYLQDPSRVSVARGYGLNGTGGLRIQIFPGAARILPNKPYKLNLKKGIRYRLSCWGRAEGGWTRQDGIGGGVCIELYYQGKFQSGFYNLVNVNQKDWQHLSGAFTVTTDYPEGMEYRLTLTPSTPFKTSSRNGAVFFDEFKLVEDAPVWFVSQAWPTHESIDSETGIIRVSSSFSGPYPGSEMPEYQLALFRNGEQLAVKDGTLDNGTVRCEFGKIAPGAADLKITLFSSEKRTVYGEKTLPVSVRPLQKVPSYACTVDEMGRILVNGEPFLPIGLYMSNYTPEEVERIGNTGLFNSLMLYTPRKFKTREGIRGFMDHCLENNLRVLYHYTFADIEKDHVSYVKEHPGLLAWYTDDETSVSKIEMLKERRRLINQLDPYHPCWGVSCAPVDFAQYVSAFDIFAYDPYPIRDADATLKGVDEWAGISEKLGLPSWAVPQIFNWGNHDKEAKNDPEKYKNFREPKEHEIRGIILTEAIHGAKAFILYNYSDLSIGAVTPDPFPRRWQETQNVVRMLNELTPFLLSDVRKIDLAPAGNGGRVRASLFQDGRENVRVLIAGIDADHDAVITLPVQFSKMKFRSKYGLTKALENGQYQFVGGAFSSDILETVEK